MIMSHLGILGILSASLSSLASVSSREVKQEIWGFEISRYPGSLYREMS